MDDNNKTTEELLAEKKASLFTEVYNKAKEVDEIENISYQKGMKDYIFFFTVNGCNCQWKLRRKSINQVKIICKINSEGIAEADAKREAEKTKAKIPGIMFHYSKIENSLIYNFSSDISMDTTVDELMDKLTTFVKEMKSATLRQLSMKTTDNDNGKDAPPKEDISEMRTEFANIKPKEKGKKQVKETKAADLNSIPGKEEKKPASISSDIPPKAKNSGIRKSGNRKNELSSQNRRKEVANPKKEQDKMPEEIPMPEDELTAGLLEDDVSVPNDNGIEDIMDEINDLFGDIGDELENITDDVTDESKDYAGGVAVETKEEGVNLVDKIKHSNLYVDLQNGVFQRVTEKEIFDAFLNMAEDSESEDNPRMRVVKKMAKERGNSAFNRLYDEYGIDIPKSQVDDAFRSAILTKQKFLEKRETALKQRESDIDDKLLDLQTKESELSQKQNEQRNEQIKMEKAKNEIYAERKELKKLSEEVEEKRERFKQEVETLEAKEEEFKEREYAIEKAKKEYEDKLAALKRYEEETQKKIEQTNAKLFDIDKRESDLKMREELLKTQNDNLQYALEELEEREHTIAEKGGDILSPDVMDELDKEHKKQEQMAIQFSEKAMESEKQQKQIEQYKKTIDAAKKKMMEFSERYNALQEELAKKRKLLKQVQKEAQEAKEAAGQASAGNGELSEEEKEEFATLRAEKEDLINELGRLRENEVGLKDELESQKQDVAKLKEQLAAKADNKQDSKLNEQIEQLNKQFEETKEQLSKAEAENVEMHNKLVLLKQKAEPNYTVLSVKEELTNMGIPCEVVPSEGPIVLKVERDGCDIYINEEEKNIIAEKPVKSAGKYKPAIEQLNEEDKNGLYEIGNKKIRVKKFLMNASQDVLFIAEKLRNFN